MIRVYLCQDSVVGFAHQYPHAFLDVEVAASLPTEKHFERPSAKRFQSLRERMESEWVRELQRLTGVPRDELPASWDADFLYGPKHGEGNDTYVLCEINASSTFAFPELAMPPVAEAGQYGGGGDGLVSLLWTDRTSRHRHLVGLAVGPDAKPIDAS